MFKRRISKVLILIIGITLILCFAACNSGGGDSSSSSNSSSGRDSRLVLGDDYAWFEVYEADYYEGFIFKANGTLSWFRAVKDDGKWDDESESYTWSTTGNNSLTITHADGDTETFSYTVTSTTLTFDDDYVLEKNKIPW